MRMPARRQGGSPPRRRAVIPIWRKTVYAVLLTSVFFLVIETLLAVFRFQPVLSDRDPYVGFESWIPLYVERTREGTAILETAENKLDGFQGKIFRPRGEAPIQVMANQCDTCRFGDDPATSVLDRNCRTHDVDNLYVVDGSFFPSNAGVSPALTIIANALRVGDHLIERMA